MSGGQEPSDATLYLRRYSCPLCVVDVDRKTVVVVGTAVPFAAGGRTFLITAAHLVGEWAQEGVLYPVDKPGVGVGVSEETVGPCFASVPGGDGVDDVDAAVFEVPEGALSTRYAPVPRYMVTSSLLLDHVDEVALVGYPVSKNKPRFGHKDVVPFSMAYVSPHEPGRYARVGLNPVTHFCAKFSHKRAVDVEGRVLRPPSPRGLSGGPAWHVGELAARTGTDERAQVVGLVSTYDEKTGTVWGPRMSHVLRHLGDAFPELAEQFRVQGTIRTTDPEAARWFTEAARDWSPKAGKRRAQELPPVRDHRCEKGPNVGPAFTPTPFPWPFVLAEAHDTPPPRWRSNSSSASPSRS